METTPLSMRKRILACYDSGKETRLSVAKRFCVPLGMVKKLIQQRRHLGDIAPLHWRAGRKPLLTSAHKEQMEEAIRRQPDTTLAEFRELLGVDCSLTAIHNVLAGMGMTYKKRRFARASRIAQTSKRRGRTGPRT